MKKLLRYIPRILLLLLPIALFVVVFSQWYLHFGILSGHDYTYFSKTFIASWFTTLSFVWGSAVNVGSSWIFILPYFPYEFIIGLVSFLGGGYEIGTRVVFLYPILLLVVLFSGVFLRKKPMNIIIASIIGLCIFTFNTFSLTAASWPNMFLAYFLIPVVFFTFVQYLIKKKVVYFYLTVLLFSLSCVYEARIAFIDVILLSFFLVYYFLVFAKNFRELMPLIKHFIFAGFLLLLLLAYTILPLIFGKSANGVSDITSQSLFGTGFFSVSHALALYHPYWTGSTFKVFSIHQVQWLFWLYPLLAFGCLFFVKKSKYILFFAILALLGVFMGKGQSQPFGTIYAWLYYHMPFFNFFREPIEWWAITSFAYAVLSTYLFIYMWQFVETKFDKRWTLVQLTKFFSVIPLGILLISLIIPIMTGSVGGFFISQKFPTDKIAFNNFINNKNTFSRKLYIPDRQRFSLFNTLHPAVSFKSLPESLQSLDPKILNMLDISYIVLPSDPTNDLYVQFAPEKGFEQFIKNSLSQFASQLKEIHFGNTTVWVNPSSPYPHLMPLSDLIYVEGSDDIKNYISLPVGNYVGYYVHQDIPSRASSSLKQTLQNDNATAWKYSTKQYIVANCIRCDIEKNYLDFISFPFARILPGSPLYPLIEKKEKKSLQVLPLPDGRITQEVLLSEKRLAEIQTMVAKKTETSFIKQTLEVQKSLLDDILQAVQGDQLSNTSLLMTQDYMRIEQKTFKDQAYNIKQIGLEQNLMVNVTAIDSVLANVAERVWVTNDDTERFFVSIPQTNDYTLFIKQDPEASNGQIVTFNGKIVSSQDSANGFLQYTTQTLDGGQYKLEIANTPNNLATEAVNGFTLTGQQNVLSIPVKSLEDPLSTYELSFDYQVTSSSLPQVYIKDNITQQKEGRPWSVDQFLDNKISEWQHFSMSFSPQYGISQASIVLALNSNSAHAQMQVKNINLKKIYNPMVIFVHDTKKTLNMPHVTFEEKNPTDYSINIHNAKNPYVLFFSEGYDAGWNLYEGKSDAITAGTPFTHEIPTKQSADIMAILLHKGPVQGAKIHVLLNDFGNGWVINKPGSYSMQLIFEPQRFFLFGIIITIGSGIFLLSLIIYFAKMKK